MGRAILVGAIAAAAFLLGCSSSTSTGSGTSGTDASNGTGGVTASGGGTSTGGATGTGAMTGAGGSRGSGGASSGGSTASGGTSGAGGGGSGGSPGKATIEFTVTGPDSYCAMMQCAAGPSIDIKDASGHSMFSVTSSCTDFSCSTCQMSPCPGYYCPPPTGVVVTGAKMEWNGSYYAKSTCGSGTSCVESVFASPGKYTATFCATPGRLTGPDGGFQNQCATSGPAKCGSVTFDFPSSVVAKGTVGP